MKAMSLAEIVAACQARLAAVGTGARVLLTLPGRWGRRTHARLLGQRGGPKGRIVSDLDGPEPRIAAYFDAAEVIAWAERAAKKATWGEWERRENVGEVAKDAWRRADRAEESRGAALALARARGDALKAARTAEGMARRAASRAEQRVEALVERLRAAEANTVERLHDAEDVQAVAREFRAERDRERKAREILADYMQDLASGSLLGDPVAKATLAAADRALRGEA